MVQLSSLDSQFAQKNARRRSAEATCSPTLLDVIGRDLVVPLVTGDRVRYVHLDYAASAPCLRAVRDALDAQLPWYSGVHRGSGFASTVMTELYEDARGAVRLFVGGRPDDVVVFTRNTTDALNLLARALPDDTSVVTFESEHHANLLPWRNARGARRGDYVHLPIPISSEDAVTRADEALARLTSAHRVLSVAGASNVTGEVFPLAELAAVAHAHGARFVVDAAQLAPHRSIDMASLAIDYLVLSGHKLYAPFGAGALIGHGDWLDDAEPYLAGGGAVRSVTADSVDWTRGPARHEAGSPNVLGALALAVACRTLSAVGMANVEAHETRLRVELERKLAVRDDVNVISMWGASSARIGVVTFTVRDRERGQARDPSALAAALGAEHGIGVRSGAFCAHPLIDAIVPSSQSEGARHTKGAESECATRGAIRASFGVGTSATDLTRFALALFDLIDAGPRASYRFEAGRYVPDPDPRPRPKLLSPLHARDAHSGRDPRADTLDL